MDLCNVYWWFIQSYLCNELSVLLNIVRCACVCCFAVGWLLFFCVCFCLTFSEETFLYLLYDSTSNNYNTTSTKYIVFLWVFWFVIMFIVVVIVTYLSSLVEKAKEKRRKWFDKWNIKKGEYPTLAVDPDLLEAV